MGGSTKQVRQCLPGKRAAQEVGEDGLWAHRGGGSPVQMCGQVCTPQSYHTCSLQCGLSQIWHTSPHLSLNAGLASRIPYRSFVTDFKFWWGNGKVKHLFSETKEADKVCPVGWMLILLQGKYLTDWDILLRADLITGLTMNTEPFNSYLISI